MENNTRDFKGIWISKEIWLSKELSLQEKVFLVEIDSLDNEKGCFASNNYFAEFFQLSRNRCSEIISSLEKKGFITIKLIKEPNKKNIQKRIIKVVEKSTRGSRETDPPSRDPEKGWSENREDNNTSNNNTNNNTKEREKKKNTPASKLLFGEFENVKLFQEDLNVLKKEYGSKKIKEYITKLDLYIAEKGNKSKNHYATIKKWITEDMENEKIENYNQQNGKLLLDKKIRDLNRFIE